jgi:hypothetical protein
MSHGRSLAVFQAIEGQRLAHRASSLTWESFVGVLEQERAANERARHRHWWGIPVAATAAGVLAVAGVVGWDGMQEEPAAPARIVRVQPAQQQNMEQMVRWSLEREGKPDESLASEPEDGLEAEMADVTQPDGRELTTSVSAPQGANVPSVPGNDEQNAWVSHPRSAPPQFQRSLPPTMPASNRFGHSQPLFRLERGFLPTQTVSFSLHD